MTELYRFIELTAYSFFRFVPYLFLFLYTFNGHFRFPKAVTVIAAAVLAMLRCLCGYMAEHDVDSLTQPNPGILILVAFGMLSVKDHFGKSLFSVWMLANISAFTVTASKWLEGILFGNMALQLHRWTNTVTLIFVEAAVLIPLFFYIKHVYLKAINQYTSKRLWSLLWLVPFTFYAVWYRNSFFSSESPETLALNHLYVIFCLLVSGGGMLIYTLVAYLIEEHAENNRLREKEYLMTLQQAQYESLKERIEEARSAKHDLRQHLHIISAYVKDKKYSELDSYIENYRKGIPESRTLIFCEHYAANALLQYFSGLADHYGIGFSVMGSLPENIRVSNDALTVLLGNLLENAVHACQLEENSSISVRCTLDDNGVFFKIINTFTGEIKKDNDGIYLSTKHKGRGIGLRSVAEIVKNHNGMMEISHENGLFIVSVLLNSETADE